MEMTEELTGPELRMLRGKLGVTQEELAVLLGTTGNTVARWERGEMGLRYPVPLRFFLETMVLEKERLNLTPDQFKTYASNRLISKGFTQE